MKNRIINLSLILLLISSSCRAQKKARNLNKYKEDLSVVRTALDITIQTPRKKKQPPPPAKVKNTNTVNRQVDAVLDSIAQLRKTTRYLSGYTIQIYAGQSREKAIEARSQVVTTINNQADTTKTLDVLLHYNQPNFLVTMGEYFSRLEAQQDLFRIKPYFSKAILVPKNIPMTKKEE